MHIHLDPIGGLAGDMFIAAVLDAFPELQAGVLETISALGPREGLEATIIGYTDGVLTGKRFEVRDRETRGTLPHGHTAYRTVRMRIIEAEIDAPIKEHAIGILDLLAGAEARIHGVAIDDVSFNELGEWDSIADVVGAGFLMAKLQASWSIGPLPLGSGRVSSAHGQLPVPAPATVVLLEGLACMDDGIPGERVTPTGAAIARRACVDPAWGVTVRRLRSSGIGFGSRQLPSLSNVLRVLVFDAADTGLMTDRVVEIAFEVDDQSPEDIAVGLDRLRSHPAVKDVLQVPAFGKKGRVAMQVRVLADPIFAEDVIRVCLDETTTLGLRYQVLDRVILPRRLERIRTGNLEVGVKIAERQSGRTLKVEVDDLARISDGRAGRERIRRDVEAQLAKRDTRK